MKSGRDRCEAVRKRSTADVQAHPARLAGLRAPGCGLGPCHEGATQEYVLGHGHSPRARTTFAGGPRGSLGGALGRTRHTASTGRGSRGRVFDRHTAADGVRFAPRRPCLLYAQTDIVARYQRMTGKGCSTDRLGRQRPPTERSVRTTWGQLRTLPCLTTRISSHPRSKQKRDENARRSRYAAELHRVLQRPHQGGRTGFRAPVPQAGHLSQLDPALHDDRRSARESLTAGFSPPLGPRSAYRQEAPTLWDVDFQTTVAQAELVDKEDPGFLPSAPFFARASQQRSPRRD